MDELNLHNLCPECKQECDRFGFSESRGDVFSCKTCKIQVPRNNHKTPMLWFWASDRLWEDLNEPQEIKKPEMVQVILGVRVEDIDFIDHNDESPALN